MARILLLLIFSTLSICSWAQKQDSVKQSIRLVELNTGDSTLRPYFVIIANNKQLGIDGELVTERENTIDFLDPEWIETISIYKEESALKKYGSLGKNGVVEIVIMVKYVEQIPPEVLAKFEPIEKK